MAEHVTVNHYVQKQISSIEEIHELLKIPPSRRKGWFKTFPFNKWSDNPALYGKGLVGKPAIAAFWGISEKTLTRWFKRYPELPVIRHPYRCYTVTNVLMLWKITQDLKKLPPSQFDAVFARIISEKAELLGVTRKHFVETYITKSRYNGGDGITQKRIRKTRHYRKTVDKTAKLLSLFSKLSQEDGYV